MYIESRYTFIMVDNLQVQAYVYVHVPYTCLYVCKMSTYKYLGLEYTYLTKNPSTNHLLSFITSVIPFKALATPRPTLPPPCSFRLTTCTHTNVSMYMYFLYSTKKASRRVWIRYIYGIDMIFFTELRNHIVVII